jgi:hypothetical protein
VSQLQAGSVTPVAASRVRWLNSIDPRSHFAHTAMSPFEGRVGRRRS